jgi:hypothetical protein
MPAEARGGDQAVRPRIHQDVRHDPLADLDAPGLLTYRQQEVLAQTPVEERPGPRIDADHPERGEVPRHGPRRLRRRHEAVFRIAVDEHVDRFTHQGAAGNIAARQQDFTQGPAVEVNPGRGDPGYPERSAPADQSLNERAHRASP